MDFVPSQIYNQSSEAKGSRWGGECSSAASKDSTAPQVTFQLPPQLFSDQDLELPLQVESSATAIIPAISNEDHAFLQDLERQRAEQWKRRKAEEDELIRESEIARKKALQVEINGPKKEQEKECRPVPSLFKILEPKVKKPEIKLVTKVENNDNPMNLLEGYSSDE